jgi:hypothetical protein
LAHLSAGGCAGPRPSNDTTAAPLLAASIFLDVLDVFLFFHTDPLNQGR